MDEVDPELDGVTPGNVAHVIAELIFFLVAQVGEEGDGCGELIVPERLEAGNRQRSGAEGKGQGKAQVGVARLREMQFAGAEGERAQPGRTESVSVADARRSSNCCA